jgi:HEPN domain-containing protein
MPNKKLANEWISFAEKDLETAILLNKENHYTDVIAVDVQQAIEKALKAFYAFYGEKIPRTHSLEILFNYASNRIDFEDIDIVKLIIISDYYQTERYPGPRYFSPGRDEINTSIELAKTIVNKVKNHINQHLS